MATQRPPEGFVLDQPTQGTPLPEGFVLDPPAKGAPDGAIGGTVPTVSDTVEPERVSGAALFEPLASMATSIVAEPIAGLAGIFQGLNPFAEEGASGRAIEATREALTYKPRTEEGRQVLSDVGGLLEPVGALLSEAEKGLGDTVFEYTESPALASAAATMPTVIIEALGLASGRTALKATRAAKARLAKGRIAREISDSVPSVDQLKSTARAVYKEIDDAGVAVKTSAYDALVDKITSVTKKAGLDHRTTPKAAGALDVFTDLKGKSVSVTELDTLRKVAQGVAKSIEPAEAALGMRMIETIDDFLDTAGPSILVLPEGVEAAKIAKNYRTARDMWGRAKRGEILEEAFFKARNQASGFENGIRTQFRSIINNKRVRKFFTKEEVDAMTKVVRGDTKQNIARLIGKLGFSEGGATNIVGGALGAVAGAVIAGEVGAVAVPLIGQVSRKLAQRMTVRGAEFADTVIRAGKNAGEITRAYLKHTPKAQRSATELSELLTRGDIDLSLLPDTPLISEAKKLATQRRVEFAGALAPSATQAFEEE